MDKGVGGLENWTIFMDVICVSSLNRQTGKLTNRQIDSQAQTDRQTNTQKNTHTQTAEKIKGPAILVSKTNSKKDT